jgi:cysteine protease ATG4
MSGMDYKRFVRFFYDPPPKYDDMSGTSIWLLGQEYKAIPPKPVSTTDHEDVVEIESSADSHDPSEATASTTDDTQQLSQPTSTSFDDAQVITSENTPALSNDPADGGWPQPFLDDFESRIWMTYRSNFPPIPRSSDPSATTGITFSVRLRNLAEREGFSSDTGWGCMIRSGQSLLANALIILHLGREWRRKRLPSTLAPTPKPSTETPDQPTEPSILSLFADDPSAPFSIHRFVHHGATSCGKHPGQWFGPSATASCIKELSSSALTAGLRVYVTPSGSEVYEDRFHSIACAEDGIVQPTLILSGIRLGLDRITPVYHEALKSALTYPQSIGIAGGRPSSSHYFIGHQGDLFLYLDPHETRAGLPYHANPAEYTDTELDSAHTRRLRGLRISEMDPSMLIGFLIRDAKDFEDWKRRLRDVKGKPIVTVYKTSPPQGNKERKEAVDEVETFDDEDEEDTVTVTGNEEGRREVEEDERQAARVKVVSEEGEEGVVELVKQAKMEDGVGREMLVGVGRGAES